MYKKIIHKNGYCNLISLFSKRETLNLEVLYIYILIDIRLPIEFTMESISDLFYLIPIILFEFCSLTSGFLKIIMILFTQCVAL